MLSEELDEAAIERSAEAQRFHVYNERCILGALSSSAGIGLLAWVLWTANGALPALTWAVLIGAVELAILGVGLRGRRAVAQTGQFDTWKQRQWALTAVCGMTWGLAVWFAWRPGEGLLYLATLTMLVAVAGVSMVTMASYSAASLLFFGGIYLVPLLHSFVHPVPTSAQLQVGLLVGWLVQLTYTRELGKVVVRDAQQFVRNEALVNRLNDLVQFDQLTGAHTRRHTFSRMEQLVASRQRHGTPASVVMFDLDHFKRINDSYGHPAGDRALREVAHAVVSQLRDGDLLGRVGGEEFLVLLPQTDLAAAGPLAERLRKTLAQTAISDRGETVHLPASFGMAELRPEDNQADWFRRADRALYEAKAQGRNRVVAAP